MGYTSFLPEASMRNIQCYLVQKNGVSKNSTEPKAEKTPYDAGG
jgi:hypothetical protein